MNKNYLNQTLSKQLLTTTAAGSLLWLLQAGIATAASFSGLGFLGTDPSFSVGSIALDVTADGSKVVGRSSSSLSNSEAFIWDSTNGMQGLGFLKDDDFFVTSDVNAISNDGTKVVGLSSSGLDYGLEAFIWDSINGMQSLNPTNDYVPGGANGISGDGKTVVGYTIDNESIFGNTEAFIWDSVNGVQGLGFLDNGEFFNSNSVADDVSDNGSIVVGNSTNGIKDDFGFLQNEAFIWDKTNGMQGLGFLANSDDSASSTANAVSADGTYVVGMAARSAFGIGSNSEAFIWDKINGMRELGVLKTDSAIYSDSGASDVSGDGSIVVGGSSANDFLADDLIVGNSLAFIWDKTNGMRSLEDVLTDEYGLDLGDWELDDATAISDDGSTIVGIGINPEGQQEAWIARLDSSPTPTPQTVPESSTVLGLLAFVVGATNTIARKRKL